MALGTLTTILTAAGLALAGLVVPATDARAAPPDILNPGFETGTLSGWTVLDGTAFSDASAAADTSYWDRQTFDQHNFWHLRSGRGDDAAVGVLQSETFTLAGNGTIDLLVGGTTDVTNAYVALVRDSDGAELGKVTGPGADKYDRFSINAPADIGQVVRIKVVDSTTTGHINVDDINVPPSPTLNKHVEPALYNHDFELTDLNPGEIRGWASVSGTAFQPSSLTHETEYSAGGPFRQAGARHLWGFKAAGDGATGAIRSSTFTLTGTGWIDFLIGGGNDSANLYVALRRASDGAELFRATGRNSETYQRVAWNAAAYLGADLYFEIVDRATGGWGHINADDFRVQGSPYSGGLYAHWKLDEGTGKVAGESVTNTTDPVSYHLNEGVNQPAQDPLWRSDGVDGKALLFDGYSTWVTRTPDRTPAPTTAITVQAWVAPRNYEHGDEGRLSAIVSQHDREAKEGFVLGTFRHGTWGLQFGTGSEWLEVMSDQLLPLDEWSHLAATYDAATGEAVLYLNGQRSATAQFAAGKQIRPSARDLLIGKNNQGMWLYGFDLNMFSGLIDDVKLRGTAMTASAVQTEYENYLTAAGGNLPTADTRIDRAKLAADKQRPQYHASAQVHWQNEPGGPFYFNGQYHVFYQSNPRGPYWNHIRWGHLVSSDMVHWRDAKDAIIPERHGVDPDGAWAGGSTLDGNGKPVLFYTAGDDRRSPNQRINIARSNYDVDGDNDLNRWIKSASVVVDQQPGQGIPGEFRDPFVFRDGDTWFMLVTSGKENVGGTALVYSTTDPALGSGWTYRGELYVGDYATYPQTGRVWELPNLMPLGTSGKHILLINPAKMERSEYQSRYTYYWIGTWNPATARFVPDDPEPQLLDVGEHFTGPAGFVTPDGRTVVHSIAQGRRTATMDRQAGYAHNFGLPVSLSYRPDGRLGIEPISELASLRGAPLVNLTDTTFAAANNALASVDSDMVEIEADIDPGTANEVGISVLRSPGAEEQTTVYYKRSTKELTVDRRNSSLDPDVEKWFQLGTVDIGTETIKLRMFVDRSMIETYFNGLKGLTTRAYPTRSDAKGIRLWANADEASITVRSLKVWPMASAYPQVTPTGVAVVPASRTLPVGDSHQLTANVTPQNASNKDVIWTSSNTAVATVVNGRVTAKAVGAATITARTRLGGLAGTSAIMVVAEPAHGSLVNHDFETGNLTGWTATGTAFSNSDVTTAGDWGWGGPFRFSGNRHVWSIADGGPDPDTQTGTLRSADFTLGGNGQIDFLIGGGDNIYDLRIELVRASDGAVLFRSSGGNREAYARQSWDASDYVGSVLSVRVVDTATGAWGHLNIDDVNVPVAP